MEQKQVDTLLKELTKITDQEYDKFKQSKQQLCVETFILTGQKNWDRFINIEIFLFKKKFVLRFII